MYHFLNYARSYLKYTIPRKLHVNQIIPQLLICLLSIIRPSLGPANCYFEPSCTHFARQQLQTQSLYKALFTIAKRLLLCSPLYPVLLRYRCRYSNSI